MRSRIALVAGLLALVALTFAANALAGNGGFAPAGPDSPGENGIDDLYWFVFGFAVIVFFIVEAALIVFIVKYRRGKRARDAEGPQVHGHLNLELAWTAVPILILIAIAIFTFYKLPGIKNVPAAGAAGTVFNVKVEGRQFYWQFTYPNGVIAIDNMHLPVNRPARMDVSSPLNDVIHSWWIPPLGGKIDAIPGRVNHTWFEPDKVGVYHGQCAEFCGIQHTAMLATVQAVPGSEFDRWLSDQARAQANGTSDLGAQEFNGVCAKCHGGNAEGGVGPNIASNAIIQNRDSLDAIVRNGKGQMPPVGQGWTKTQMDALYAYLHKRFGNGS